MKSIIKSINRISCLALSCLLLLNMGCMTNDVYQKQVAIPNAKWSSQLVPEFVFDIQDTTARYKPQFLLRHDDNYPFSNIWLKVLVQLPGDSVYTDSFQTEITLADNEGNWLGEEQSVNWTHRIGISSRKFEQFKRTGQYKVKIRQLMRQDPLTGVLNMGWRLDKVK